MENSNALQDFRHLVAFNRLVTGRIRFSVGRGLVPSSERFTEEYGSVRLSDETDRVIEWLSGDELLGLPFFQAADWEIRSRVPYLFEVSSRVWDEIGLCEDFRVISVRSADLESLSEAAVVFARDGGLYYCQADRVVGVEFE